MTYVPPVLQPTGPQPLSGQALLDFFQEWLVALTGLGSDFVRPYLQSEPPVIPEAGTAWMAFQPATDQSDTFPYVGATESGGSQLQRQERIKILCSFYDLGSTGLADGLARLLRDNLAVPQNLEVLLTQGMGMVGCDPEVVVPSLLKIRWLYRVDVPFYVRRQVTRVYEVPSIETADAELITDIGIGPIPIHVEDTP